MEGHARRHRVKERQNTATTVTLILVLLPIILVTTVTTTPAQIARSAPQQNSNHSNALREGAPTTDTYWAKTYGGSSNEIANSVQQTADGGYVVAGYTGSFGAGDYDVWVLKLNSTGSVDWQKTYGGSDFDIAYSVQQTSDGGYVVAGGTWSFGAGFYDFWVLKLYSSGSMEWQKTYGGNDRDYPNSVQQTSDGGYIVAGATASFGAGIGDFWVLKLDSSGSVVWQKTYGGSDWDDASSIQQTADGGYIVAGRTDSFGAGGDFWVLKLNSTGSVTWQKTYGGSSDDYANSVQQTADGGYVVAGYTTSFGASGRDFWVLKLNSTGSVTWQKTYGGSGTDGDWFAVHVRQTSDGGYIVAGYTTSFGAGNYDVWVLKLNSTGSVVWDGGSGASTQTTSVVPSDSGAVASTTSATPASSAAAVQDTQVTPQDTHATVTVQSGGHPDTMLTMTILIIASIAALLILTALVYVRRRRGADEIPTEKVGKVRREEEKPVEEEEREDIAGFKKRRAPATLGRCIVCNLDVREDQSAVWCPYCGKMAHRIHMLEWLRIRNDCPECHHHLDERDLRSQWRSREEEKPVEEEVKVSGVEEAPAVAPRVVKKAPPVVRGVVRETPLSVAVPPEKAPPIPVGRVSVLRGGEVVGDEYIFKVKISNDTDYNITDVLVTLTAFPDDCLSGGSGFQELRRIRKIEAHGSASPAFAFKPTRDCVKGTINVVVSYMDHLNKQEILPVEPHQIDMVCGLLRPLIVDEKDFESSIRDWAKTDGNVEVRGMNARDVFKKAPDILRENNFYIVASREVPMEGVFAGVIKGYAQGKYSSKRVGVTLEIRGDVYGEDSFIKVVTSTEEEAMLAPAIREVLAGLRKPRLFGKKAYYEKLGELVLRIADEVSSDKGGIVSLADLCLEVKKREGAATKTPVDSIEEVVNMLCEKGLIGGAKQLSSGIKIIEVKPIELSKDLGKILSSVSSTGVTTAAELIKKTKLSKEVVETALQRLEHSGMAKRVIEQGNVEKWYFPAFYKPDKR